MNVAISGNRYWIDHKRIYDALSALDPNKDFVILGDAKGADTIARKACRKLELPHIVYVAHWSKEGRAAGPKRNARMLENADELWYFHHDLKNSKGTLNCVTQARNYAVNHNRPISVRNRSDA